MTKKPKKADRKIEDLQVDETTGAGCEGRPGRYPLAAVDLPQDQQHLPAEFVAPSATSRRASDGGLTGPGRPTPPRTA